MSATHARVVVWVGHIDPTERAYNDIIVALDWSAPDLLDQEYALHFRSAFDYGVSPPPGIGFWIWEGNVEWYDDRGSIPDGEVGCWVTGESWRPARALEVWAAQRNARKREKAAATVSVAAVEVSRG